MAAARSFETTGSFDQIIRNQNPGRCNLPVLLPIWPICPPKDRRRHPLIHRSCFATYRQCSPARTLDQWLWEIHPADRLASTGWSSIHVPIHSTKLVTFIYWDLFSSLKFLLIYSMVQSPSWEANRFAAIQEIPRISRNPNVHYRTHKCYHLSLYWAISILSINPISHFLKICLNIILPSVPGSPQWSLFLRFAHQNPVHASSLPHTSLMPSPSHSSRFYPSLNFGWGVQMIMFLIGN